MRALTAAAMAAGLVGLGLAVIVSGRTIAPSVAPPSPSGPVPTAAPVAKPVAPGNGSADANSAKPPEAHARAVGDDEIALPDVKPETLVREAPRDPLSQLSQALPPPPPEITVFYRPVATASATFDSMGYTLAIAGTQSVSPDETCTSNGVNWPCGMRARTAVRLWLRGRAMTCKPPPKDKKQAVVSCALGKQDVGDWLVSNGWARAAAGGPYAEAQHKAEQAGAGIFGAPPASIN